MEQYISKLKHFIAHKKKELIMVIAAFLAGAFWIVALRFVTISSDAVHYHANFAVFVNGERLKLDSPLFYEEVQACGGEEVFNPKIRVHMHNQINSVIHVHDAGATWGHFFANIGLTNGDSVFRINQSVYLDTEKTPITYVLNGEKVDTTANRTIKSEDVLLISIGTKDEKQLADQFAQIPKDAGEYNNKYDPSGCSGGKDFSFSERLKKSVGVFGE